MRLQLVADLLLQRDARIEHHTQQADDLQVLVEIGVHLLDRVDQVGQPFEREVLALHRHDDAMGGTQAVEREQAERGRAIDQDEVVFGADRSQCRAQTLLATIEADHFDFGTGQFAVGAQDVVAAARRLQLLGFDTRFGHGCRLEQHVIHRQLQLALVDPGPHGRVALRIEIDHEHALAHFGQTSRQIDGGGRLADAALLIGDAENFGHAFFFGRLA